MSTAFAAPAGPPSTPPSSPPQSSRAADPLLLVDLLAGPKLGDAEQRELVRQSQAGTAMSALLELDALDDAGRVGAEGVLTAAAEARTTLVAACLPLVVTTARETGMPCAADVETALAAVITAIGRYDPDEQPETFTFWVAVQVTRALRDKRSGRALETGEGEADSGNGMVTAARVRAALAGHPLKEREAQVLALRFGDGRSGALSLAETGERMNLTRYEVRAVEARVMARLRQHPSVRMPSAAATAPANGPAGPALAEPAAGT